MKYFSKTLLASCVLSLVAVNAFAVTNCPDATVTAINAQYGAALDGTPTSEMTTCLLRRHHVKAVIGISASDWNAKAGKARQIVNVFNLIENYTGMYGMEANKDFHVLAIGYGAGARWWLTDEAYDRLHGTNPTVFEPNPSKAAVLTMLDKGIKVLMCQNTMKANGYLTADLIPGVKMVPAGVTSIVDAQLLGFKYLNP